MKIEISIHEDGFGRRFVIHFNEGLVNLVRLDQDEAELLYHKLALALAK